MLLRQSDTGIKKHSLTQWLRTKLESAQLWQVLKIPKTPFHSLHNGTDNTYLEGSFEEQLSNTVE